MKKTPPLATALKGQLTTRSTSTLAAQWTTGPARHLIVTSADDRGVIRNGGRKGARFAPASLLKSLSLMQYHPETGLDSLAEFALATGGDFVADQKKWSEQWRDLWTQQFKHNQRPLLHLGGGHDHIYPLLLGFEHALTARGDERGICVLNIDAHLDTRIDPLPHSGTPFRQAALELKRELHLIQWGIHLSANATTTCRALPAPHRTTLFTLEQINEQTRAAERLLELVGDSHLIISLDADAIDGAQMRAVSAVNARGLASESVFNLIEQLASRSCGFGIYEYNPLFDDLSNYGSRMLAKLALTYLERSTR